MPHRLAQRHALAVGPILQCRLRYAADAALRNVHDAAKGHRVIGVRHRDEVAERVLDFGALVELGAAQHPVGQRRSDEDLLQRTRLRVGAIEHGDIAVFDALLVQLGDLVGDELRLVVLAVAGETDDLLTVPHRGEQLLVDAVEVVADDGVRGAEDVLRRAVVLLEQHHLRPDVVALELDDVADVRPAEGIDRLVRVADDGERGRVERARRILENRSVESGRALQQVGLRGARQLADQRVLRVVGVLVLVDEDVPEPALV